MMKRFGSGWGQGDGAKPLGRPGGKRPFEQGGDNCVNQEAENGPLTLWAKGLKGIWFIAIL